MISFIVSLEQAAIFLSNWLKQREQENNAYGLNNVITTVKLVHGYYTKILSIIITKQLGI